MSHGLTVGWRHFMKKTPCIVGVWVRRISVTKCRLERNVRPATLNTRRPTHARRVRRGHVACTTIALYTVRRHGRWRRRRRRRSTRGSAGGRRRRAIGRPAPRRGGATVAGGGHRPTARQRRHSVTVYRRWLLRLIHGMTAAVLRPTDCTSITLLLSPSVTGQILLSSLTSSCQKVYVN